MNTRIRRRPPLGILALLFGAVLSFGTLAATAPAGTKKKAAAKPKKESAVIKRLKRAYRYIYRGNLHDLKVNRKAVARYRKQAASLQLAAKHSNIKKASRKKYLELARLFEALSKQNAFVLAVFSGRGEARALEAMKTIPKLEKAIHALARKKLKRNWLTFAEVDKCYASGLRFRTEAKDILPYAKRHWYEPKKIRKKKEEQEKEPTGKEP